MTEKPSITVAGTGFVGLVTAAIFADRAFPTTALDVVEEKIKKVNQGEPFFYEPQLPALLKRVVLEKRTLQGSTDIIHSIQKSDITFICVGTPSNPDGSCNLQYVKEISSQIGKALGKKKEYHLIVAKSTIEPSTTRKTIKPIIELESGKRAGEDFGLCMNPEFLREGQSIYDSLYPDRVIIGEYDEKSGKLLDNLFTTLYDTTQDAFTEYWQEVYGKPLVTPPICHYSLESAEAIKYANNSFLATKISFINEFANICEKIEGIDIQEVAEGIGLDHRISKHFLQAGAGFGGSCFPKDVKAIIHFAKKRGYQPALFESVLTVNDFQAKHMVDLAEAFLEDLENRTVVLLGLSFKPNTDDMRNAPSLKIIDYLRDKEASIVVYDPEAMEEAQKEEWLGDTVTYASSIYDALEEADACLLITEWPIFKELRPKDFLKMKTPVLIDGRRIYDHEEMVEAGITFAGIGLGLPQTKKPAYK
ncbi:MAG: UDP-glucose/GDP-mannose dehydrogenase family protein [Asgard group archaeon]|nr:UDP-glucose/GDP-mannose dehydrogenase family protein [Asgard group archaeon]